MSEIKTRNKGTRKIKIANWLSYKTTIDVNKYIKPLDDALGYGLDYLSCFKFTVKFEIPI